MTDSALDRTADPGGTGEEARAKPSETPSRRAADFDGGVVEPASGDPAPAAPPAWLRGASMRAARAWREVGGKFRRRPRRGRWRAPISFSTLTGRIIALNMVGLIVFLLGVLFLNQFREGLIEQRHHALEAEAALIALTIAEAAGKDERRMQGPTESVTIVLPTYDRILANEVLRRLTLPVGTRAQLVDPTGRVTGDTRRFRAGARDVEAAPTPRADAAEDFFHHIELMFDRAVTLFAPPLERREDFLPRERGIARAPEIYDALGGEAARWRRFSEHGELILSVAVPIRRVRGVMGALVLSTADGEIERVVDGARRSILEVSLVACAATLLVAFLLAQTIARPIRRLAAAADPGNRGGRPDIERIAIPDMTRRTDEIGELSGALRRMTKALYERIAAIESFAADVAHEIKNPLTSLRSAVETLRLAKTDEQRARLLAVIEHDVARMDRLVTDISNASRLDAELVREQMTPFDLAAVLEGVAAIAEPKAERRGVRIHTDVEGPMRVRGIDHALGRVFHNLIDNALSFSPEGGRVMITAGAGELDRRPARRIVVEDEGPGIPPANLESIFQRFYSERGADESFGNHSGLGLSICRQIVEAHNGRIWAENRAEGGGARFVVLVPR